jgi:hypothetical protein
LNPLGESAEVAYTLKFVIGELNLEMLLDARQEIERLKAIDSKLLEEVVVGSQLFLGDLEMVGSQAKDFIDCILECAHALLSCHKFGEFRFSPVSMRPCSGAGVEYVQSLWLGDGERRVLRTRLPIHPEIRRRTKKPG